MNPVPEVVVDGRDAISLAQQLLARRLGYVPEWQGQPADSGTDAALVRIVARYLETIIQRLNRAPEKNRLAFFAMLGLELVPPQAARAPVVFEPLSQQRNLAQEALKTMQAALKSLQAVLPSTVEQPALQSALDIREYLHVTRAPAGTQVAAAPARGDHRTGGFCNRAGYRHNHSTTAGRDKSCACRRQIHRSFQGVSV